MPFRKLRKNRKRWVPFRARRTIFRPEFQKLVRPTAGHIHRSQIFPQNGKAKLPQVAETEMASKNPQVPSSLENLPSEIRRHILSMVNVDSLKALVQASPVYFHQYRLDRKLLLCQSLESTLGSVTADAYAVHRSNSIGFSGKRTTEGVQAFITFYRTIRSQAWSSPLHKVVSTRGVTSMIKFHCSIIQPLMRCFVTQALSKLTKVKKGSQIEETLSRTEETRLMRAFYRYQLCHNLYSLETREFYPSADWLSISNRIQSDFLCIFNPWEAEEISCISYFSERKHKQVRDNLYLHMDHMDREKFDFNSDVHDKNRDSVLKTPMPRGLEMLHFIYVKIESRHNMVTRMQSFIIRSLSNLLNNPHYSFDGHLQRYQQCAQPEGSLIFQGDQCFTLPPLAWTRVCGGGYKYLFQGFSPSAFRQWGWVMWDAARFERLGADHVMMQQWNEESRHHFGYPYW
ncbi:hypothetical protein LT330_001480 [Penicillium expansum]|nr:hypothetical protein LT330_001480 [Penicillium expansum]